MAEADSVVRPPLEKPKRMKIVGEERSLEALLEKFAGIWEISDENVVNYRRSWNAFLPQTHPAEAGVVVNRDWCMAYNPLVAVRKCYPTDAGATPLVDLPYFIVILNAARDQRPTSVSPAAEGDKDPLQKNLIDKDMIIAEFDEFLLAPNGYPYHRYASLLIAKDPGRSQSYPTPHEISTWMRFSILTKQFVFFNSPNAGASIPRRMHVQVVDPQGIRYEDGQLVYPILNPNIMRRTRIRPGVDRLDGYGIQALALRGRDAPHRASLAVTKLRDEQGHWFNLMVNGKEVIVVPRNAEKETSHCIGKKVGAYEMSGTILVGNIEEPLLEEVSRDRVVDGAEIFSQLNYEQIATNVANATANLGGLENDL